MLDEWHMPQEEMLRRQNALAMLDSIPVLPAPPVDLALIMTTCICTFAHVCTQRCGEGAG